MIKDKYFITTERFGFRKWCKNDLHLALGLWGDFDVTKFIDARGKLSDDQVAERLAGEIECGKKYGVQYWPFFLLESGEHAGCCGLRPYDSGSNIYEIGFHICSSHWRKGFACEAAHAVIKYAFENLYASALFAGHNPWNKASAAILNKLGFNYIEDNIIHQQGLSIRHIF